MEESKKDLTIKEYFDVISKLKKKTSKQDLQDLITSYEMLGTKYMKTGQIDALKKIIYYSKVAIQEQILLDFGINTYVLYSDVKKFVKAVSSNHIHLIELERYEREIPDTITEKITKTKDVFDQFYVLFTDYTGQHAEKDKKEKIEKDPILFGAFKASVDEKLPPDSRIYPRLYFVGDWIDEYCDLTFDKFVSMYKEKVEDKQVSQAIETYSFDSMKEYVNQRMQTERQERETRIQSLIVNKRGLISRFISWVKTLI